MKKKITLILFLILLMATLIINTKAAKRDNLVNIYFFHSNTCLHCKEETIFLNQLKEKYKNIKVYKYEIHKEETKKIITKVEKNYQKKITSVPVTIIGNEMYVGFSEQSKIKFIKTIEYFSRYGYKDKIGEYLNLDLPFYSINKKDISLENFINNYNNYSLFGLKTDNLDTSSISILLGLLSSFHVLSIIGSILIVLIVTKQIKIKNKFLSILLHVIITNILLLTKIVNKLPLSIIIYLFITLLLIYTISKVKQDNKDYLYMLYTIIITLIISTLIFSLSPKQLDTYINLLELHNLKGLNKMSYFSNYFLIRTLFNSIIIYTSYIIINKFSKKNAKIK